MGSQFNAKFGSTTDDNSIFAVQPNVIEIEQCSFYHTMDIPRRGVVDGLWDLRRKTDEYLGHYAFSGKRVLEVGPASGFLTFEMEKQGASIVAIDVKEDPGWDFVPYPDAVLEPMYAGRRYGMGRLRNSFWFAHRAFNSAAKVWYGDTYALPDALGQFDVAVMAAVLLHVNSPFLVMAQCAKRASTLVVTDLYHEDLEGKGGICRLNPTAQNKDWGTWWHFSSDVIRQFAAVLGFTNITTSKHSQVIGLAGINAGLQPGQAVQFFTVVASR